LRIVTTTSKQLKIQVMVGVMRDDIWYGPKGKVGILLVHGFTGTPEEMEGLAKYLAKRKLRCLSVFLKGHGEDPRCLIDCCWEDWLKDLDRGFKKLKKDGCKKIWIVGYSLGCPLAEAYILKHRGVAGICLIGPTISRIGLLKFLGNVGALFERYLFVDFKLKTDYLHYTKVPLKSAREVVRCFDKFSEYPADFPIPVLVLHAEKDERVSFKDSKKLFDAIKSKKKEFVVIKGSTHAMVVDKQKKTVFKEVYTFIKKNS
jgi:carboxylesterase